MATTASQARQAHDDVTTARSACFGKRALFVACIGILRFKSVHESQPSSGEQANTCGGTAAVPAAEAETPPSWRTSGEFENSAYLHRPPARPTCQKRSKFATATCKPQRFCLCAVWPPKLFDAEHHESHRRRRDRPGLAKLATASNGQPIRVSTCASCRGNFIQLATRKRLTNVGHARFTGRVGCASTTIRSWCTHLHLALSVCMLLLITHNFCAVRLQ